MWTYRLIIQSREDGELCLYGSERELTALKTSIEARLDATSEETVTYRGRGDPVGIWIAGVGSLSDVDPVVVPDDLALTIE